MEFKIKVFQDDEGIFAEVLTKKDEQVCVGEGNSPFLAVKEACEVLADIMTIAEEEENMEIAKIVEERRKNDESERFSLEDVKRMRLEMNGD